jgi:hypothetical protein
MWNSQNWRRRCRSARFAWWRSTTRVVSRRKRDGIIIHVSTWWRPSTGWTIFDNVTVSINTSQFQYYHSLSPFPFWTGRGDSETHLRTWFGCFFRLCDECILIWCTIWANYVGFSMSSFFMVFELECLEFLSRGYATNLFSI